MNEALVLQVLAAALGVLLAIVVLNLVFYVIVKAGQPRALAKWLRGRWSIQTGIGLSMGAGAAILIFLIVGGLVALTSLHGIAALLVVALACLACTVLSVPVVLLIVRKLPVSSTDL
jgi:hypothetical protein